MYIILKEISQNFERLLFDSSTNTLESLTYEDIIKAIPRLMFINVSDSMKCNEDEYLHYIRGLKGMSKGAEGFMKSTFCKTLYFVAQRLDRKEFQNNFIAENEQPKLKKKRKKLKKSKHKNVP